jgi:chromosome segregation ATPase
VVNDVTSNAGVSMISKNFATRREVEMRKLEQELLKINQRYEQVTDPIYLASLKGKLKEMETNYKMRNKNMANNEKEITLLDKKIVQQDQKTQAKVLNMDGNLVEKKAAVVLETQSQIEQVERKLDEQHTEIDRLEAENQELKELLQVEKDKEMKLKTIASEKYNMDLMDVDVYLPKGKGFYAKVHKLERAKIDQAKKEQRLLR